MVKWRWVTVALVGVLVAAGCGSSKPKPSAAPATSAPASTAPSGPLPKITFSGVTPNAGNWALQVGVGEGIFKKFGIDASLIYSQSSPAALAALFGGSVQFTTALYDAAIPAFQKNPDLVYVASGYDLLPYELVTQPSITNVTQLKGKTCGAQNPPTVGDGLYDQLMISDASNSALKYPKDFSIATVTITAASALAALKTGQVQCLGELPPVAGFLNNNGFPTLIKAADLPRFKGLPFFGLNTLKSWLSGHQAETVKFLTGYLASIAWLEDPVNKQAAIDLLAKNASLQPQDASASYQWVLDGGYPRQGLIKSDALSNDLGLAQQFGRLPGVKVEQLSGLVDLSLVKQAYTALPDSVKNEPSAAPANP